MENWIKVGKNPKYEVSNEGHVRNRDTGRLLKPQLNKDGGYERVRLSGRWECVHKLVADAFFAGNHDNKVVIHRDGDRHNNHISNLEWSRDEVVKDKRRVKRSVVTCKYCKHRGRYEICMGKCDDFYCGFGDI
jgi:hypothetical protein